MQEGREGKKNDGGREIVRLMYTEVVRNTGVSCFLVFFVPFLSFFRSSLSFFFPFFREKQRISNCFHPMIERENIIMKKKYTLERNFSEFRSEERNVSTHVIVTFSRYDSVSPFGNRSANFETTSPELL